MLEALTDPARRRARRPALRAPATEVLQHIHSEEALLSAHDVGEALRTTKRGSAAGLPAPPLSCTNCSWVMRRHSNHSPLQ